MGACGEEKIKNSVYQQQTVINVQLNGTNTNTPQNYKLKAVPNIKKNYQVKFLNTLKNDERNENIEGDSTLKQILNNMESRENADFEIEFENNIRIGNDKMEQKFNDILKEIFKNEIPEIINMKYIYKGLDIPENIIQAYQETSCLIGCAIIDNDETFGIIVYDNDKKLITPYYYKRSDYPELNNLNSFTAYCNAKGYLYFSGGEKEQNYEQQEESIKYNNFICINLTELNGKENKLNIKKLDNLKEARSWHSMIFIPNKYIFIVGGSITKSVELYDMDKNQISKDSELNKVRNECTLCVVNNRYLYAFFGFVLNEDYNNSIERCDLFKEQRKWEIVNISIKNGLEFKPSFFAISYFKDNDLILIGGSDTGEGKRSDYIYKLGKGENGEDEIEEYPLDLKENAYIFKDKFFIPMKNNINVNIPLIIGEEIKVIIFNSQDGNVSFCDYQK